MKKNQLISLLESIKGNPEIKLWNGFVGDWQDIAPDVVEQRLVKMSLEHMKERCIWERERDGQEAYPEEDAELTQCWKENYKWEMNSYVKDEDISNGVYKSKKIFLLQAKLRGETYSDRLGKICF